VPCGVDAISAPAVPHPERQKLRVCFKIIPSCRCWAAVRRIAAVILVIVSADGFAG
jgi:hypothetical protein